MSPRRKAKTRAMRTMQAVGESQAMAWVKVLTPILLALFAVRQSGQAKDGTAEVANATAAMVQDEAEQAGSKGRIARQLAGHEHRITQLEEAGERPSRGRRGVTGKPQPSTREGQRPEGVLSMVSSTPVRVWKWLTGG